MRIAHAVVAQAAALLLALAAPALADGDVAVSVDVRGDVRVAGDDLPNQIEITSGPLADEITISGIGSTLVNGAPGGVIASDVRSLRIDMLAGSDDVDIVGVTVRDLRARLGDGHDSLLLDDVIVRGRFSARGGYGRDRVVTSGRCVFRRSVKVLGDAGIDDLQLRNVRALGRVRLRGGRDDDRLVVDGSAFVKFGRLWMAGDSGRDDLIVHGNLFDEEVDIRGGRDSDQIHVADCGFEDDVDIDGGRDNDEVTIRNSDFEDDATFDGNSGHDDLDLGGHLHFEHGRGSSLRIYSFEHRH